MHRRYNRWWGRFDQPDPSDGSYELTDPQSLNRYSYVQNDPVNFVDPSGLLMENEDHPSRPDSLDGNGFWSPGIHMTTIWKTSQTSSPPTPDANDSWTVGPALPFTLIFVGGGGGAGGNSPVAETGRDRMRTPPRTTPQNLEPLKPPPNSFLKCFGNYKFSSNFTGKTRFVVEAFEVGSEISLLSDLDSIRLKGVRSGISGPKNRYASGINRMSRGLGKATHFGDKLSPVLAVPAVFTGSYILAVAVQCGLGTIN
jgi:hypothetical protein